MRLGKLILRTFAILCFAIAAILILSVLLFALFTGPSDLTAYSPPAESPYQLPWEPGVTRLCIQGNRAVVSHRNWEEYAYDFTMPVGSPVCAARGGEVIDIVIKNDGHGYKWPNNRITIRHEDGTLGHYLHLKKDGAKVNIGDQVEQGQVIAESGHVGNSMLPHLHFHVTDENRKHTLPVSFRDVSTDNGVPRMFKHYTARGPAMD